MQTWKPSNNYFWESVPFFRLLLPFVIGIILYDRFSIHISITILSCLIVTAIIILFITKSNTRRSDIIKFISLTLLFASLGLATSYISDIKNHKHWFGNHLKQSDACVVKILEAPQEKEKTYKLLTVVEKIMINNKPVATSGEAFIYVYKNGEAFQYQTGDELIIPSAWQLIKNSGNPDEFNYAGFCKRNNIYYQQFLNNKDLVKTTNPSTSKLSFIRKSHEWAMRQLALYIKDSSVLGLLQAMLLGDKVNFSEEDRQLYVNTGIVHIVAISGAHIGVLLFLVTSCFFWIKQRKHQWIKMVIAIPFILFYVMIAGAPASAVRAAVMFILLAISIIIKREKNPLNILFAAAFFILLIKPTWLFAVGFQLSFAAVLSLILFYKKILSLYASSNLVIQLLWKSIAASLAAEILIAPLVVYYFHLFPVAFLLANLLAVLLMGVVIYLGIGIIAFSWLPVIAKTLSAIVTFIVIYFQKVIAYISLLNPASFKFLHLSLIELLLCYLLIAAFSFFIIQKTKATLYLTLISFSALLISFNIKEWESLHQKKIVVYNVSKHAYTEYISGHHYSILSESEDNIDRKKIDFAVREHHIKLRALQENKQKQEEVFRFGNQKILFLKSPVLFDTTAFDTINYVILQYPVKEFEADKLQKTFHFNKLIVTGNQRRKNLLLWKDSCEKQHINAHFTMLDGAFTIL